MSFNDLVKFLTQQFVTYVNQPTEERRASKLERKATKPPVLFRMFGLVPLAFVISFKNSKVSKRLLKK